MKKTALFICVTVLLFSCKEQVTSETVKPSEKKMVAEEKTEKEPTTPEETEYYKPVVQQVNPVGQNGAPSDAIVLFDGTDFSKWISSVDSTEVKWTINKNGSMTVKDKTGDIQTKQDFGSVQLHLEWRSNPDNKQTNQNRSNSGVFFQNRYEVQILDNNDNPTYVNGMVSSVYKQSPPLVMAAMPTGEWNTYDIVFHAPEFDDEGNKTKSGTLTVFLNNVLVQDHFELEGTTEYIGWPKNDPHGKGPIKLQDHQDMSGVSFRNIWVRELD